MDSTHILLTPPTVPNPPVHLHPAESPATPESQINCQNALPQFPPPKILLALQGPLKGTLYQRSCSITMPLEIYSLPLWLVWAWSPSTAGPAYCELYHNHVYTTLPRQLRDLEQITASIWTSVFPSTRLVQLQHSQPLQGQKGWITQVKHLAKVVHLVTLKITGCNIITPSSSNFFPNTLHQLGVAWIHHLQGGEKKGNKKTLFKINAPSNHEHKARSSRIKDSILLSS